MIKDKKTSTFFLKKEKNQANRGELVKHDLTSKTRNP